MCATGERMRMEGKDLELIKDFSPDAIKLGYDFSVVMHEKDNEKALEIITKMNNYQQYGVMKNNG